MIDKYSVAPVTYLARNVDDALEANRYRSPHDPEVIAYRKELEGEQMRIAETRRNRPSFEQRVMQRFAQKRGK
ncbi:hypothetical protein [Burkholderia gladioli]|uniref:hypothetical protein n=1 Tax=Burkholderia gladioli TaxID=28095 RepID=UPI00163E984C|nr:hypothetical protein [Burkholderia gladioli]